MKAIAPNGYQLENWPGFWHSGLIITSKKTGNSWIFDFSGSQYGINQVFWNWNVYEQQFKAWVKELHPFGTHKHLFNISRNVQGQPSLLYGLGGVAAVHLHTAVIVWARDSNLLLTRIRELDDAPFSVCETDILKVVGGALDQFIKANDSIAMFKTAQNFAKKFPGRTERDLSLTEDLFFSKLNA